MADLDMLLQDQATTEGALSLCTIPSRVKGVRWHQRHRQRPRPIALEKEGRHSRRWPQPSDPSGKRQVARYSLGGNE